MSLAVPVVVCSWLISEPWARVRGPGAGPEPAAEAAGPAVGSASLTVSFCHSFHGWSQYNPIPSTAPATITAPAISRPRRFLSPTAAPSS